MIIDLTLQEIIDLAEFSGLTLDKSLLPDPEDLDQVICITRCHKDGLADDDGQIQHFNYVMYFEDCPEEGVIPLGMPIEKK